MLIKPATTMTNQFVLKTDRLILRPWKGADLVHFAALCGDPRVMECFPSVKTFEETNQEYQRICNHFTKNGWGLFAAELKSTNQFIGFIGLNTVSFNSTFTPAVEIGWRLAHEFWGKGYAPEGAKAALEFGFKTLGLAEIVAFTVPDNIRSQTVMRKINMTHSPGDFFEHPLLPKEHKLSRHILYRIHKTEGNT